jgi:hypothetical protein
VLDKHTLSVFTNGPTHIILPVSKTPSDMSVHHGSGVI